MKTFDVTIAGEINLDLILYGLPFPLVPGRELLAENLALTLGSSSAILAHNLAALGNRVGFNSRVGRDPLGQIAIDRLTEAAVNVTKVRRADGPVTTGITVILSELPSRYMLAYPGTMHDMCFEDLDLDYLTDSKHFHLSSFFLHKALRSEIPRLFRHMKMAGLTTSLDTNDDPEDRWGDDLWETLKFVDVFLPNEDEARRIARTKDLESAVSRLCGSVPVLAVKMGSQGALGICGNQRVRSSSLPVDVVDQVGAGDSFNAGFIHEYIRGSSLEICLAKGNLCGALSTTRAGGTEAFRDPSNVKGFFARNGHKSAQS